jgi:YHS domain-containing protein
MNEAHPMRTDPVCGRRICRDHAFAHAVYDRLTYYFCSPRCRAEFEAAPEQYARPEFGERRSAPASTTPIAKVYEDSAGGAPSASDQLDDGESRTGNTEHFVLGKKEFPTTNGRQGARFFDPICGMWLDADKVTITFTYIGWTYAFCSEECRDLFVQKPDVHVVRLAQDPEAHIAHCCPHQRGLGVGQ